MAHEKALSENTLKARLAGLAPQHHEVSLRELRDRLGALRPESSLPMFSEHLDGEVRSAWQRFEADAEVTRQQLGGSLPSKVQGIQWDLTENLTLAHRVVFDTTVPVHEWTERQLEQHLLTWADHREEILGEAHAGLKALTDASAGRIPQGVSRTVEGPVGKPDPVVSEIDALKVPGHEPVRMADLEERYLELRRAEFVKAGMDPYEFKMSQIRLNLAVQDGNAREGMRLLDGRQKTLEDLPAARLKAAQVAEDELAGRLKQLRQDPPPVSDGQVADGQVDDLLNQLPDVPQTIPDTGSPAEDTGVTAKEPFPEPPPPTPPTPSVPEPPKTIAERMARLRADDPMPDGIGRQARDSGMPIKDVLGHEKAIDKAYAEGRTVDALRLTTTYMEGIRQAQQEQRVTRTALRMRAFREGQAAEAGMSKGEVSKFEYEQYLEQFGKENGGGLSTVEKGRATWNQRLVDATTRREARVDAFLERRLKQLKIRPKKPANNNPRTPEQDEAARQELEDKLNGLDAIPTVLPESDSGPSAPDDDPGSPDLGDLPSVPDTNLKPTIDPELLTQFTTVLGRTPLDENTLLGASKPPATTDPKPAEAATPDAPTLPTSDIPTVPGHDPVNNPSAEQPPKHSDTTPASTAGDLQMERPRPARAKQDPGPEGEQTAEQPTTPAGPIPTIDDLRALLDQQPTDEPPDTTPPQRIPSIEDLRALLDEQPVEEPTIPAPPDPAPVQRIPTISDLRALLNQQPTEEPSALAPPRRIPTIDDLRALLNQQPTDVPTGSRRMPPKRGTGSRDDTGPAKKAKWRAPVPRNKRALGESGQEAPKRAKKSYVYVVPPLPTVGRTATKEALEAAGDNWGPRPDTPQGNALIDHLAKTADLSLAGPNRHLHPAVEEYVRKWGLYLLKKQPTPFHTYEVETIHTILGLSTRVVRSKVLTRLVLDQAGVDWDTVDELLNTARGWTPDLADPGHTLINHFRDAGIPLKVSAKYRIELLKAIALRAEEVARDAGPTMKYTRESMSTAVGIANATLRQHWRPDTGAIDKGPRAQSAPVRPDYVVQPARIGNKQLARDARAWQYDPLKPEETLIKHLTDLNHPIMFGRGYVDDVLAIATERATELVVRPPTGIRFSRRTVQDAIGIGYKALQPKIPQDAEPPPWQVIDPAFKTVLSEAARNWEPDPDNPKATLRKHLQDLGHRVEYHEGLRPEFVEVGVERGLKLVEEQPDQYRGSGVTYSWGNVFTYVGIPHSVFHMVAPKGAFTEALLKSNRAEASSTLAARVDEALEGWQPDPRKAGNSLLDVLGRAGIVVDISELGTSQADLKELIVQRAVDLMVDQPTRGHYYTPDNFYEAIGISYSVSRQWKLADRTIRALEEAAATSGYRKVLEPIVKHWVPVSMQPKQGETLAEVLSDQGLHLMTARAWRADVMSLFVEKAMSLIEDPPPGMVFNRERVAAVLGMGIGALQRNLEPTRATEAKADRLLTVWDLSSQHGSGYRPQRRDSARRWNVDLEQKTLRHDSKSFALEFVPGRGKGFLEAVLFSARMHPQWYDHTGMFQLFDMLTTRQLRHALADAALDVDWDAPDLAPIRTLLNDEGLGPATIADQLRKKGDFWSLAADLAPRILSEIFGVRMVIVDPEGNELDYSAPGLDGPDVPELVLMRDPTRGTDLYWATELQNEDTEFGTFERSPEDQRAEQFARHLAATRKVGAGSASQMRMFGEIWHEFINGQSATNPDHEAQWNTLYFAINDALHDSGVSKTLNIGSEFDHNTPIVRRGWDVKDFGDVIGRLASSDPKTGRSNAIEVMRWLRNEITFDRMRAPAQEFVLFSHVSLIAAGHQTRLPQLLADVRRIAEAEPRDATRLWNQLKNDWSDLMDTAVRTKLPLYPPQGSIWGKRSTTEDRLVYRRRFREETTQGLEVSDDEHRRHIIPSHQFKYTNNSWLRAHYPPSHLHRSQAAQLLRGWQEALDNNLVNLWAGDSRANTVAGGLAVRLPYVIGRINAEKLSGNRAFGLVQSQVMDDEHREEVMAVTEELRSEKRPAKVADAVTDLHFSVDFDWPGGTREQYLQWTAAYLKLRDIMRSPRDYSVAELQKALEQTYYLPAPTPNAPTPNTQTRNPTGRNVRTNARRRAVLKRAVQIPGHRFPNSSKRPKSQAKPALKPPPSRKIADDERWKTSELPTAPWFEPLDDMLDPSKWAPLRTLTKPSKISTISVDVLKSSNLLTATGIDARFGYIDFSVQEMKVRDGKSVSEFTIGFHLAEGEQYAPGLEKKLNKAVGRVFNRGVRLPNGNQVFVRAKLVEEQGAHANIAVTDDPSATMDQHNWHADAPPTHLAHEIGHFLGLYEEYFEPDKLLNTPVYHDDSIMSTGMYRRYPKFKPRHAWYLGKLVEQFATPQTPITQKAPQTEITPAPAPTPVASRSRRMPPMRGKTSDGPKDAQQLTKPKKRRIKAPVAPRHQTAPVDEEEKQKRQALAARRAEAEPPTLPVVGRKATAKALAEAGDTWAPDPANPRGRTLIDQLACAKLSLAISHRQLHPEVEEYVRAWGLRLIKQQPARFHTYEVDNVHRVLGLSERTVRRKILGRSVVSALETDWGLVDELLREARRWQPDPADPRQTMVQHFTDLGIPVKVGNQYRVEFMKAAALRADELVAAAPPTEKYSVLSMSAVLGISVGTFPYYWKAKGGGALDKGPGDAAETSWTEPVIEPAQIADRKLARDAREWTYDPLRPETLVDYLTRHHHTLRGGTGKSWRKDVLLIAAERASELIVRPPARVRYSRWTVSDAIGMSHKSLEKRIPRHITAPPFSRIDPEFEAIVREAAKGWRPVPGNRTRTLRKHVEEHGLKIQYHEGLRPEFIKVAIGYALDLARDQPDQYGQTGVVYSWSTVADYVGVVPHEFRRTASKAEFEAVFVKSAGSATGTALQARMKEALRGWLPDPGKADDSLSDRLEQFGVTFDVSQMQSSMGDLKELMAEWAVDLVLHQPVRGHFYTADNVHEALGLTHAVVGKWRLSEKIKEGLGRTAETSGYRKVLEPHIRHWLPESQHPGEGGTLVEHLVGKGLYLMNGKAWRPDVLRLLARKAIDLIEKQPLGMVFNRSTVAKILGLNDTTLLRELPPSRRPDALSESQLTLWDLSRQWGSGYTPPRTDILRESDVDLKQRTLSRGSKSFTLEFVPGRGEGFLEAVLLSARIHPQWHGHTGMFQLFDMLTTQQLRDALADGVPGINWDAPDLQPVRKLLEAESLGPDNIADQLRQKGDFWSLAADLAPRILSEIFGVRMVITDPEGGELDYSAPGLDGPDVPELVLVRETTRGSDYYWATELRGAGTGEFGTRQRSEEDQKAERFVQQLVAARTSGSPGSPEQLRRFGLLWHDFISEQSETDPDHEARWNALYFAINDALRGSGVARNLQVGSEFDHNSPVVRRGWDIADWDTTMRRFEKMSPKRARDTALMLLRWLRGEAALSQLTMTAQEIALMTHLGLVAGGHHAQLPKLVKALQTVSRPPGDEVTVQWAAIRMEWSAQVTKSTRVNTPLYPPSSNWRMRSSTDEAVVIRRRFLKSTRKALDIGDKEHRRHIIPSHQFRHTNNSWLKAYYPPSHLQRTQTAQLLRGWQDALDNNLVNLWIGDAKANTAAGTLARGMPDVLRKVRTTQLSGERASGTIHGQVMDEAHRKDVKAVTNLLRGKTDPVDVHDLATDLYFSVDFDWPGGTREQFLQWTGAYLRLREAMRNPRDYPVSTFQKLLVEVYSLPKPTPKSATSIKRPAEPNPGEPPAKTVRTKARRRAARNTLFQVRNTPVSEPVKPREPVPKTPGDPVVQPGREVADSELWRSSELASAPWFEPLDDMLKPSGWAHLRALTEPVKISTISVDVLKSSNLFTATGIDARFGYIDFSVQEMEVREDRWVSEFTVGFHLAEGQQHTPGLQKKLNKAVGRVFNRGVRLPNGHQVFVKAELVGDDQGAHANIAVTDDASVPLDQHHWHADTPPTHLAHEIGHFLGLYDEYFDPEKLLRTPVFHDDSVMADEAHGKYPKFKPRHAWTLGRLVEQFAVPRPQTTRAPASLPAAAAEHPAATVPRQSRRMPPKRNLSPRQDGGTAQKKRVKRPVSQKRAASAETGLSVPKRRKQAPSYVPPPLPTVGNPATTEALRAAGDDWVPTPGAPEGNSLIEHLAKAHLSLAGTHRKLHQEVEDYLRGWGLHLFQKQPTRFHTYEVDNLHRVLGPSQEVVKQQILPKSLVESMETDWATVQELLVEARNWTPDLADEEHTLFNHFMNLGIPVMVRRTYRAEVTKAMALRLDEIVRDAPEGMTYNQKMMADAVGINRSKLGEYWKADGIGALDKGPDAPAPAPRPQVVVEPARISDARLARDARAWVYDPREPDNTLMRHLRNLGHVTKQPQYRPEVLAIAVERAAELIVRPVPGTRFSRWTVPDAIGMGGKTLEPHIPKGIKPPPWQEVDPAFEAMLRESADDWKPVPGNLKKSLRAHVQAAGHKVEYREGIRPEFIRVAVEHGLKLVKDQPDQYGGTGVVYAWGNVTSYLGLTRAEFRSVASKTEFNAVQKRTGESSVAARFDAALRDWKPDPRVPDNTLLDKLTAHGLVVDTARFETSQADIKELIIRRAIGLIVHQPTRGHHYTLKNFFEALGFSDGVAKKWKIFDRLWEVLEREAGTSGYRKILAPVIREWIPQSQHPGEGETLHQYLTDLGLPVLLSTAWRPDTLRLFVDKAISLLQDPPEGMAFNRERVAKVLGIGESILMKELPPARQLTVRADRMLTLWDLSRQWGSGYTPAPSKSGRRWNADVHARTLRQGGEKFALAFVPGRGEGFFESLLLTARLHPRAQDHHGMGRLHLTTTSRQLRDALADGVAGLDWQAPDLQPVREMLAAENLGLGNLADQLRRKGDFWSLAADLAPRVLSEIFGVRMVITDPEGRELDYSAPGLDGPGVPELVLVRDPTRGTDFYWATESHGDGASLFGTLPRSDEDQTAERFARRLAATRKVGEAGAAQMEMFGEIWRDFITDPEVSGADHEAFWNTLYFAVNDAVNNTSVSRNLYVGSEFDHTSPVVRRGWDISDVGRLVGKIIGGGDRQARQIAASLLRWRAGETDLGKLKAPAQDLALLTHVSLLAAGRRDELTKVVAALKKIADAPADQAIGLWNEFSNNWSELIGSSAHVELPLYPPSSHWARRGALTGSVITRTHFRDEIVKALEVGDGEERRHIIPSHLFRKTSNSWLTAHYPPSHLQRTQPAQLLRGWQQALDNNLPNLWAGDGWGNHVAGGLSVRLPWVIERILTEKLTGNEAYGLLQSQIVDEKHRELVNAVSFGLRKLTAPELVAREVTDLFFSVDFDWPGGTWLQYLQWTGAYLLLKDVVKSPRDYSVTGLQQALTQVFDLPRPEPEAVPEAGGQDRRTVPTRSRRRAARVDLIRSVHQLKQQVKKPPRTPGTVRPAPRTVADDERWRKSTARSAPWFEPLEDMLKPSEWAHLRALSEPVKISTISVDVLKSSDLTKAVGIDARFGYIDFGVQELKVREDRWVSEFTVGFHVAQGQQYAAGLEKKLNKAVGQVFNRGVRLPNGHQVFVRAKLVEEEQGAHANIAVTDDASVDMDQHHWHADTPPTHLAHEIGHFLGLYDEYFDPEKILRTPVFHDDSVMADGAHGRYPRFKPRHAWILGRLVEQFAVPSARTSPTDVPQEPRSTRSRRMPRTRQQLQAADRQARPAPPAPVTGQVPWYARPRVRRPVPRAVIINTALARDARSWQYDPGNPDYTLKAHLTAAGHNLVRDPGGPGVGKTYFADVEAIVQERARDLILNPPPGVKFTRTTVHLALGFREHLVHPLVGDGYGPTPPAQELDPEFAGMLNEAVRGWRPTGAGMTAIQHMTGNGMAHVAGLRHRLESVVLAKSLAARFAGETEVHQGQLKQSYSHGVFVRQFGIAAEKAHMVMTSEEWDEEFVKAQYAPPHLSLTREATTAVAAWDPNPGVAADTLLATLARHGVLVDVSRPTEIPPHIVRLFADQAIRLIVDQPTPNRHYTLNNVSAVLGTGGALLRTWVSPQDVWIQLWAKMATSDYYGWLRARSQVWRPGARQPIGDGTLRAALEQGGFVLRLDGQWRPDVLRLFAETVRGLLDDPPGGMTFDVDSAAAAVGIDGSLLRLPPPKPLNRPASTANSPWTVDTGERRMTRGDENFRLEFSSDPDRRLRTALLRSAARHPSASSHAGLRTMAAFTGAGSLGEFLAGQAPVLLRREFMPVRLAQRAEQSGMTMDDLVERLRRGGEWSGLTADLALWLMARAFGIVIVVVDPLGDEQRHSARTYVSPGSGSGGPVPSAPPPPKLVVLRGARGLDHYWATDPVDPDAMELDPAGRTGTGDPVEEFAWLLVRAERKRAGTARHLVTYGRLWRTTYLASDDSDPADQARWNNLYLSLNIALADAGMSAGLFVAEHPDRHEPLVTRGTGDVNLGWTVNRLVSGGPVAARQSAAELLDWLDGELGLAELSVAAQEFALLTHMTGVAKGADGELVQLEQTLRRTAVADGTEAVALWQAVEQHWSALLTAAPGSDDGSDTAESDESDTEQIVGTVEASGVSAAGAAGLPAGSAATVVHSGRRMPARRRVARATPVHRAKAADRNTKVEYDELWRWSEADSASWFDPLDEPLKPLEWEHLRALAPVSRVSTESADVLRSSDLTRAVGIDARIGHIDFGVQQLEARKGRWVSEFTVTYHVTGDTRDLPGLQRKLDDAMNRVFNQGVRLPNGDQVNMRALVVGDQAGPQGAHAEIELSGIDPEEMDQHHWSTAARAGHLAHETGHFLGFYDDEFDPERLLRTHTFADDSVMGAAAHDEYPKFKPRHAWQLHDLLGQQAVIRRLTLAESRAMLAGRTELPPPEPRSGPSSAARRNVLRRARLMPPKRRATDVGPRQEKVKKVKARATETFEPVQGPEASQERDRPHRPAADRGRGELDPAPLRHLGEVHPVRAPGERQPVAGAGTDPASGVRGVPAGTRSRAAAQTAHPRLHLRAVEPSRGVRRLEETGGDPAQEPDRALHVRAGRATRPKPAPGGPALGPDPRRPRAHPGPALHERPHHGQGRKGVPAGGGRGRRPAGRRGDGGAAGRPDLQLADHRRRLGHQLLRDLLTAQPAARRAGRSAVRDGDSWAAAAPAHDHPGRDPGRGAGPGRPRVDVRSAQTGQEAVDAPDRPRPQARSRQHTRPQVPGRGDPDHDRAGQEPDRGSAAGRPVHPLDRPRRDRLGQVDQLRPGGARLRSPAVVRGRPRVHPDPARLHRGLAADPRRPRQEPAQVRRGRQDQDHLLRGRTAGVLPGRGRARAAPGPDPAAPVRHRQGGLLPGHHPAVSRHVGGQLQRARAQ